MLSDTLKKPHQNRVACLFLPTPSLHPLQTPPALTLGDARCVCTTHRGRHQQQLLNGKEQSNTSALTTVAATRGGEQQALLKNPTPVKPRFLWQIDLSIRQSCCSRIRINSSHFSQELQIRASPKLTFASSSQMIFCPIKGLSI